MNLFSPFLWKSLNPYIPYTFSCYLKIKAERKKGRPQEITSICIETSTYLFNRFLTYLVFNIISFDQKMKSFGLSRVKFTVVYIPNEEHTLAHSTYTRVLYCDVLPVCDLSGENSSTWIHFASQFKLLFSFRPISVWIHLEFRLQENRKR